MTPRPASKPTPAADDHAESLVRSPSQVFSLLPVRVTGQIVGASCDDRAMTGMATRHWTEGGTTWFAISGIAPELEGPAERLLMGYQRHGGEWRRAYPADTPDLGICWQNFSNLDNGRV